jgi:hypothetical protein
MDFRFEPAQKEQSRLRMGIDGPPGAGKTYTALGFGRYLADKIGKPLGVVDTEFGSASKYVTEFGPYNTLQLTNFSLQNYIKAIKAAEAAGFGVLVIDSLSHAWAGVGGALEMVNLASAASRGNSFAAWKDVTPLQERLTDTIMASPMHIICCLRSKISYEIQTVEGRSKPVKIGLQPVQRNDIEYLFDIYASIDQSHIMRVTKSRCPQVDGAVSQEPPPEWIDAVYQWLTDGTPWTPPHWSDDEKNRLAFENAALNRYGLDMESVCVVLGIERISDWEGSGKEALDALERKIKVNHDEETEF